MPRNNIITDPNCPAGHDRTEAGREARRSAPKPLPPAVRSLLTRCAAELRRARMGLLDRGDMAGAEHVYNLLREIQDTNQ